MKIKNWDQYKDLEYYPDRYCACGCGGRIKVLLYHKDRDIPKYVNGHARRGMSHTDPNCTCCICRAKKGGYIGSGNPMYGIHPLKKVVLQRIKSSRNNGKPWHSDEAKKKYSITKIGKKNPMFGKTGNKSPSWIEGLNRGPYSIDFDEKLKESIRERDNYTC